MRLSLPDLPRPADMPMHDYAYRRLRQAIMVGAIRPGEPLTIRGIAEAAGLSPTPVREALRRLSSEKALDVLENRRILVPAMTLSRFDELVALRTVLETHAARRALPHVTDIAIARLDALDGALNAALAAGDHDGAVLANQAFHAGIYNANPDTIVMPMIESVWLQLGPFQRVAAEQAGPRPPIDRHKDALLALHARDAEALGAAIAADIAEGVGRLGRALLLQN